MLSTIHPMYLNMSKFNTFTKQLQYPLIDSKIHISYDIVCSRGELFHNIRLFTQGNCSHSSHACTSFYRSQVHKNYYRLLAKSSSYRSQISTSYHKSQMCPFGTQESPPNADSLLYWSHRYGHCVHMHTCLCI